MRVSKFISRWFAVFALPTLTAFSLAFIVPFVLGLVLSFCKFTTVLNAKFIGTANYGKIFTADSSFPHALGLTVLFALASVASVNGIAFVLALLLTRGLAGTNALRTVFFMPNLIGGIVLGYIWQQLLNGLLAPFDKTVQTSVGDGFWGMVVVFNWQMIGYMMIIYIAGIQNVSGDVLEAASIDGAGYFTTVFKILLPNLVPSITICTFLTLSQSFKMFDQNLSLTAGQPGGATKLLALDIYDTFYNMGPAMRGVGQAKAVVFFVFVGVVAFLQLRATRSKEVEG
ncbi:MAG: sugar ABC transporter permease [Bifidobacteriaceae bacterium]|jgi:raffinose/stachyose/melibiose transport system permease protein|nr:sugar ABC transporter permease [Bifidobacteriaceae bacterium]